MFNKCAKTFSLYFDKKNYDNIFCLLFISFYLLVILIKCLLLGCLRYRYVGSNLDIALAFTTEHLNLQTCPIYSF